MKQIVKFIKAILQPEVFFTFVNYTVKIFLNPIIILFIPIFLEETVQGYWYTFGSIAALTSFADLGFTSIMTQYVAHEYTYLKIDHETKLLSGPEENIKRMASLFRFVIGWIVKVLAAALVIIFVVGIVVFSQYTDGVKWQIPWIIYVIGTVFNFASQVFLSFFEGCSQFSITQKIRTVASVIHCVSTIVFLAIGWGLYALGLSLILKGIIVFFLLYRRFGRTVKQMRSEKEMEQVQWKKEFVPLLGKYAISWVSGYFAQQIYNPLAFSIYGSVYAGKVGYCLSIVQAIYSVANVWNVIAVPKYNMAVEKKEWPKMDAMIKKNIIYSVSTYAIGIVALFTIGRIPLFQNILWSRLLEIRAVIVLALAYAFSLVTQALAGYLRAHKQEPFLIISVMSGALSAVLTVVITRLSGVEGIFIGLLITNIILMPWEFKILKSFRLKWHS